MADIDRGSPYPDLGQVATAMKRLETAIRAATEAEVDERLERFVRRASKSRERLDVAFAAVQTLRDLETINVDEAAYLFQEVCSNYVERLPARKQVFEQIAESPDDYERLIEMLHRRDRQQVADLHREWGEVGLADLMLGDPDSHGLLCAEGEISLMMDKPEQAPTVVPDVDPQHAGAVAERVFAFFATESWKQWVPEWHRLVDALGAANVSSAIAAVRGVRELGVISFDESLALIDVIIGPDVEDALQADREAHRLDAAIERLERDLKASQGATDADNPRVAEQNRLQGLLERRCHRMLAVCLRRHGEHRMANLWLADPAEYERIRDSAGGPVGTT